MPKQPGHPDHHRQTRKRVEEICRADSDAHSLRVDVLAELTRALSVDAYVWVITDPETTVGSAPLAEVPSLIDLPALIAAKYASTTNRWTSLVRRQPPVAALVADPAKDAWSQLLRRHDVTDVASVAFADGFGCWGFLDLWRIGERPFAAADLSLLADLAPTLTTALRLTQARTFVRRLAPLPRPSSPMLLVLSDALTVLGRTAAVTDWLRILLPRSTGLPVVPAGAYNVAAQLLAVESGVDEHLAQARVHLADGLWLTLRAARIVPSPDEPATIAVTLEEASPHERLDLFARAFGLSGREAELLHQLAGGSSTRLIARRMGLSEHTVQDHLKAVFGKAQTHSRAELLSRALGGSTAG